MPRERPGTAWLTPLPRSARKLQTVGEIDQANGLELFVGTVEDTDISEPSQRLLSPWDFGKGKG